MIGLEISANWITYSLVKLYSYSRGQIQLNLNHKFAWSGKILNYCMMVERYPNLKEEVGSSIPDSIIFCMLDRNLQGGQLSFVLWQWHVFCLKK